MIIHTVYRPEEHINFIKDWLDHHTAIGVEHFYLYDNGGSIGDFIEWNHGSSPGVSKYGYYFDHKNIQSIREAEYEIIKNYPVTKIMWQPKDFFGNTVYGYNDSLFHFSNIIDNDLCAFIDIDEFIIKKEKFFECRIFQKKFKHRGEYLSVYDCYDACDIDTSKMDTKVILNMKRFKKILQYGLKTNNLNMHFQFLHQLARTENYYNHYNHNKYAHDLLTGPMKGWMLPDRDMANKIVPYDNVFYKVTDHGLKKNKIQ